MDEREQQPILALIPAYNEGPRITAVIKQALTYLPVLVIDDGSADDTAAQARSAGAKVMTLIPNQGKGVALRLGFTRALEDGYSAVITLDADGQHNPDDIPSFLAVYRERQPDLIIGRRNFEEIPGIRRLANFLGEKTFSWAIGQNVPDNQSGYRLITRRLMIDLLSGMESGFEFELEMIIICVRQGYLLDSVPIETIYAGESSHIDPVNHLANFLRVVARTKFNN